MSINLTNSDFFEKLDGEVMLKEKRLCFLGLSEMTE